MDFKAYEVVFEKNTKNLEKTFSLIKNLARIKLEEISNYSENFQICIQKAINLTKSNENFIFEKISFCLHLIYYTYKLKSFKAEDKNKGDFLHILDFMMNCEQEIPFYGIYKKKNTIFFINLLFYFFLLFW